MLLRYEKMIMICLQVRQCDIWDLLQKKSKGRSKWAPGWAGLTGGDGC